MVLALEQVLDTSPDDACPSSVVAAAWRACLPTPTELRRARLRLHLKSVVIVAVLVVGYWAAVIADLPIWMRFPAAGVMVIGLIGLATGVMHDANHGAFSSHRWLNDIVAYSSDLLGGSSWLWRFKHNNLHHGNTNVVGVDSDISQAPFARLAPGQPWRPWHRGQHIYLWFLYGFMTLKNLLFGEALNVMRGHIAGRPLPARRRGVLARMTLGKLVHVGWAIVVPVLFNPWWKVLLFYVACSWLVGFALAITFQLAHCVDEADFADLDAPRRGEDFAMHQLRTTGDVLSPAPVAGHAFRWIVGGLDHQIEHHLAPRLPHTVYSTVAKRFRRRCDEAGLPYRVHLGVWAALRSHARWLKLMGQPTAAAL